MEFLSEPIDVRTEGRPARPASFTWREREFVIIELESVWQDWGYAAGAPAKTSWRLRRHRNYYRVKTGDGRRFEIYLDRKDKSRKRWYIYREVSEDGPDIEE